MPRRRDAFLDRSSDVRCCAPSGDTAQHSHSSALHTTTTDRFISQHLWQTLLEVYTSTSAPSYTELGWGEARMHSSAICAGEACVDWCHHACVLL